MPRILAICDRRHGVRYQRSPYQASWPPHNGNLSAHCSARCTPTDLNQNRYCPYQRSFRTQSHLVGCYYQHFSHALKCWRSGLRRTQESLAFHSPIDKVQGYALLRLVLMGTWSNFVRDLLHDAAIYRHPFVLRFVCRGHWDPFC